MCGWELNAVSSHVPIGYLYHGQGISPDDTRRANQKRLNQAKQRNAMWKMVAKAREEEARASESTANWKASGVEIVPLIST
jgi:hypothetical protein